MAESAEHQFLKSEAIKVLADFSRLRLYGYTETDRKKFDFSCLLERDWSRPMVGQVLWKHSAGIDKDLRTLLFDGESEIKLYLACDRVEHHQLFEEVIGDFRRSAQGHDLFKLKTIWLPGDFDADSEKHRIVVSDLIRTRIVTDILLNVVFGNLSEEHIRFFLNASGFPGLNLAILWVIATEGFFNFASLSKRLEVSTGPIREKIHILAGAGFITTPLGALRYEVTLRGRVFLELLHRLISELQSNTITEEMAYILERIGCPPSSPEMVEANSEVFPSDLFVFLLRTSAACFKQWGIQP